MNDVMITSAEGISSSMDAIMEKITTTIDQLVEIFDRSIDVISRYWVKAAKKVKDFGIKFLKQLWFIDKELFQLLYIKNHLNDILNAVEKNNEEFINDAGILMSSLTTIKDLLVERCYMDNYFRNNFLYVVENDINPVIDKINSKIIIK